ncbi:MAG: hypothetical protein LBE31_07800, partial [Deltaproteobacteria bacterium]|nr:hypothetical protein [Deltaproteobacteria bacterium]
MSKKDKPGSAESAQEQQQKLTIWDRLTDDQRQEVEAAASDYRAFLSSAKTERAVSRLILDAVTEAGFTDLLGSKKITRGGYLSHHG